MVKWLVGWMGKWFDGLMVSWLGGLGKWFDGLIVSWLDD